jgi:Protein of unknown function DUF262/Protein of unknown function (DUF1524)
MIEAYNSQAKSMADLLSETHQGRVVVPTFQRGYSWGKKHVEAFWNDLQNFRRESQAKGGPDKYFLGPIVVMPHPENKEVLYLLDGQQRLATATILLSVLRDIAHGLGTQDSEVFAQKLQSSFIEKEDYGLSLELGELDKTYFRETVQQYEPNKERVAKLRSHQNIANTKDFLMASVTKQLAGKTPAESLTELKAIRTTIRNDLKLASITVGEERDAFRIFETLNDRGLRLSTPDLLLNYLMGRADGSDSRKQIRSQWDDMVESMGKQDIDRFIRHMWLSKYGDLKNIDLFSALKSRIEADTGTVTEFVSACANECELYVQLWEAKEEDVGPAAPYVKALVRDLHIDSSMPLLLSAYKSVPPADLEQIVRWVLVFVTRYSIVVGYDSGGMESIFYALARDVRKSVSDLTEKTPESEGKKIIAGTLALIKGTLSKNSPTDDIIKQQASKLFLDSAEAKYVLSRIARHMQSKTKEMTINDANIEHIFPKSPVPEWGNTDDLQPLLWHIGNLTMLGRRINKAARSKTYEEKKAENYQASELAMVQELVKKYDRWRPKEIQDRGHSFGPLINEVWSFDNPSRV